ncbi:MULTISPECIES: helix-turn-helix transcriptional regulator [Streptococcus]|uniref:Prophage Sa05, DNA-binding protein n=2 Tax=Streptococcus TaxID=1301 RepID=A0A0Z8GB82_STRSU|nr:MULTISPECIES: helix-turn-helix transcriptional regulator [Streptococcus]MDY7602513.1 helix-turn-helix transcriptional regulator [Streptococcus suis]UTI55184.1 helix-turn-helix transcriptional regulator [Streptococcus suis]WNY49052.1 helix-turn-helix transcriptional regulator [Streptococcus sp. 29892]CYU95524.1 prophage Sa05%2C DNA-binding protein [Streptococcus suis]CYV53138.1 prophage Sa05%2C DNA-binding protein [Streptococcus suis]
MNRLKELRKEKKLTQEELASEIGVSKITILRWENGERQIKPDKAQALADHFGVSVGYLLGYETNPKKYDDELVLTNPRTSRIFTHSYKQEKEKVKDAFDNFVLENSLLLTDEQIQAFSSMIADLHTGADYKYFGQSIQADGLFEPVADLDSVLEQMKKDGYNSIFSDS